MPSEPNDRFIKPLTTICITVAHASVESSKPKVELDSYADTCAVGDNCLVLHDYIRQLVSTVMIQQVIMKVPRQLVPQQGIKIHRVHRSILENHLLCPMQCHRNNVHISEVPKFIAESSNATTHAISPSMQSIYLQSCLS